MRQLPNSLTILRILLVAPIVWALLQQRIDLALGLFVVAAISDGLDGLLARRFNWQSRLGAILDPLADKLLLVSSYCSFSSLHLIPWWLTLLVIMRDLTIMLGAGAYRLLGAKIDYQASCLGKLSTFFQLLLALWVLLELAGMSWLSVARTGLIVLVAILTFISGLHYVIQWSLKFKRYRLEVKNDPT